MIARDRDKHMLARLGRTLYWGGIIGSALLVISAFAGTLLNLGNENWAAIVRVLAIAGVAWASGRAALYILAGR
jgi:hypothetical protein